MKSSGVIALVTAGVVVGGGVATYELTKPSSEPVQVNYVQPAATDAPTTEPTTATATPTPVTSTTTATKSVAVTSTSSTTRKATVQKEATVASETTPAAQTSTTPPAPDDPIRSVAPPPIPGNGPQISGDAPAPSGTK